MLVLFVCETVECWCCLYVKQLHVGVVVPKRQMLNIGIFFIVSVVVTCNSLMSVLLLGATVESVLLSGAIIGRCNSL